MRRSCGIFEIPNIPRNIKRHSVMRTDAGIQHTVNQPDEEEEEEVPPRKHLGLVSQPVTNQGGICHEKFFHGARCDFNQQVQMTHAGSRREEFSEGTIYI